MVNRQQRKPLGFTLKQLLIAIIVIAILIIVGSVTFLIQKSVSTSNSQTVEQTMQVAKAMQEVQVILSDTKKKAAIEGKSYTVQFRNDTEGLVEYSTSTLQNNSEPIDLQPEWKKLSYDTGIKVQESKSTIVFYPNDNLNSPTKQLAFEYKGYIQKICPPTYLISTVDLDKNDKIQNNLAQYLKEEAKKQEPTKRQRIIIIKKAGKPLAEIKPVSANNQQMKSDDLCS